MVNFIMNKLKILFLPSWYPTKKEPLNGIFIKKHAEAVANFCNVIVIFVSSDTDLKKKTYKVVCNEENNVLNIFVYYKRNSSFKILNLWRIVKSWYIGGKIARTKFQTPDLIHVNVVKPNGIYALILKIFLGIPYIVSEHWSGYLPEAKNYHTGFVKKFLTNQIIKNASAVTAVSQYLASAMQKKGLKNNYFVVPNVINQKTSSAEIKKNDRKRILHVSSLDDRKKNITGILKALSNIVKFRKDFDIHFIGEGKDRQFLENLTKKLFLTDHVFFDGIKIGIDLDEEYSRTDFLIVNSYFETFSVVTAEAMAMGVPVIITKCGGPEEYVQEDMGKSVEINNEKELENAIIYMMENHQSYNKEKLQNYANSKFNSEIVGKQFLEIYQKILSSKYS